MNTTHPTPGLARLRDVLADVADTLEALRVDAHSIGGSVTVASVDVVLNVHSPLDVERVAEAYHLTNRTETLSPRMFSVRGECLLDGASTVPDGMHVLSGTIRCALPYRWQAPSDWTGRFEGDES